MYVRFMEVIKTLVVPDRSVWNDSSVPDSERAMRALTIWASILCCVCTYMRWLKALNFVLSGDVY